MLLHENVRRIVSDCNAKGMKKFSLKDKEMLDFYCTYIGDFSKKLLNYENK